MRVRGGEGGSGDEEGMLSITRLPNSVAKVCILCVTSLSTSEEKIGPDDDAKIWIGLYIDSTYSHLPSLNTWCTWLVLSPPCVLFAS